MALVERQAARGQQRRCLHSQRRRRSKNKQVSTILSHMRVNFIQQYLGKQIVTPNEGEFPITPFAHRRSLGLLDDDNGSDQENVLINLPVPPAPKKPRSTKDLKAHPTGNVEKGKGKGMAIGLSH